MSEVDLMAPADVRTRVQSLGFDGVVFFVERGDPRGDLFGVRVVYSGRKFEKAVRVHPGDSPRAMCDEWWPKLADEAAFTAQQLQGATAP